MLSLSHEAAATRQTCNKLQLLTCFKVEKHYNRVPQEPADNISATRQIHLLFSASTLKRLLILSAGNIPIQHCKDQLSHSIPEELLSLPCSRIKLHVSVSDSVPLRGAQVPVGFVN